MIKKKNELWIEEHIVKYRLILVMLGISLSIFASLLLGLSSSQGSIMALTYSSIFLIVDFTRGND